VRAAKFILLGVFVFVSVRYVGVYHRATDFNRYVQDEVSLVRSIGPLKEALLLKAEKNKLPITDSDIKITTVGIGLEVSVDYQVPLDLILFQQQLTFHSAGNRSY